MEAQERLVRVHTGLAVVAVPSPGLGTGVCSDVRACGCRREQAPMSPRSPLSRREPLRAQRRVPRARPPAAGQGCPFKRPQRLAPSLSSPSAALRFGLPPPEPGRAMGSRRRAASRRCCRAEAAPAGPRGARAAPGSGGARHGTRRAEAAGSESARGAAQ